MYESESNNTLATSTTATLGTAISGQLSSNTDVDYYKFTVGSSGSLSINFDGPTNSSSTDYFNVMVYNASGVLLASQKTGMDKAFNAQVLTAGDYYVAVAVDQSYYYNSGQYSVTTTHTVGNASGYETENNSNIATSTTATLGTAISGQLSSNTDVDYYKFTVGSSGSLSINFDGPTNSSSTDYFNVMVYNASGVLLASQKTGMDKAFNAQVLTAGDYYVAVAVDQSYYYNSGQYSVTTTHTATSISMTEDITYVVSATDFPYDSQPLADTNAKIKISSIATGITLKLNNSLVGIGQEIIASDINSGNFSVVPLSNFNSSTKFQYQIFNGSTYNAPVSLSIGITPVNDTPLIASSVAGTVAENAAISTVIYDVNGNDVEGSTLSYSISGNDASFLNINSSTGEVTLKSSADYETKNSYSFNVMAYDGALIGTKAITVSVTDVNDAPVVSAPIILSSVTEDSGAITITQVQLLANASDVDGNTLSVTNLSTSTGVLVNNNNGTWTLTPATNYNGTISLNYNVTDGTVTVPTTATKIITAVNDAPMASSIAIQMDEESVSSGTLPIASDSDGNAVVYSVGASASHGTATVNANGTYSYSPAANFSGTDKFTYNISDGQGGSNTYDISVIVNPMYDAPLNINFQYTSMFGIDTIQTKMDTWDNFANAVINLTDTGTLTTHTNTQMTYFDGRYSLDWIGDGLKPISFPATFSVTKIVYTDNVTGATETIECNLIYQYDQYRNGQVTTEYATSETYNINENGRVFTITESATEIPLNGADTDVISNYSFIITDGYGGIISFTTPSLTVEIYNELDDLTTLKETIEFFMHEDIFASNDTISIVGHSGLFLNSDGISEIHGYSGNDRLTGSALGDILDGGLGNDILNGGEGTDFGYFNGIKSSYEITKTNTGMSVFGPDGYDILSNIERVVFDDKALAFDTDGIAGKAYRLYQAAFDRIPDQAGLGYWIDSMDKGVTLQDVANSFLQSQEFQTMYGTNASDEVFTTLLYNNILNRTPDDAGMSYWLTELGHYDTNHRSGVLASFSESAENQNNVAELIGNGIEYIPWM